MKKQLCALGILFFSTFQLVAQNGFRTNEFSSYIQTSSNDLPVNLSLGKSNEKNMLFSSSIGSTSGSKASSHSGDFFEKLSLEVGYGLAVPLSPSSDIKLSDYTSFLNFQAGINYELNDLFGIRLSYANHSFKDKVDSNLGISFNKFMAEATFNITEALDNNYMYMSQSDFELSAHAGFGGTLAKTKSNVKDLIINAQFGLTPKYKIDDRVILFLDATLVGGVKQNHGYNGLILKEQGGIAMYFTSMIGLQVKFGDK